MIEKMKQECLEFITKKDGVWEIKQGMPTDEEYWHYNTCEELIDEGKINEVTVYRKGIRIEFFCLND